MIFLLVLSIFACLVLLGAAIVFLHAQLARDNSIMDVYYGPLYAAATWGTMLITGNVTPVTLLAASLVTLWALRLGIRIGRKNWGAPEDARYAAWRTEWMERGTTYFILRSFIQINLLQGIIIVIVSLPLILTLAYPAMNFSWWHWLGALVMLGGLTYESTADWQLDRFIGRKKRGEETATLMKQGLFAYSRRPNYFGESMIWWGFAIMALGLPYGYLGLIGPALITFILTRVTGPMLEKQFLERYPDEYQEYMSETSYFIPLPPRALKPLNE